MPGQNLQSQVRELIRLDERRWVASTVTAARGLLLERPRSVGTWVRLGDALRAMSRFPEALQALRKALRLAPPDAQPWVCLHIGKVHDDRSSHRLAQRWYARAASLSPKEATWYICLGGMMARLGRLREAEVAHRQATRCRKGCIDEAFHNLGLVLRAQERYAEAKKCFERALKLDPKYRDAREALADVVHALQLLRAPSRNGSRKARKGR